MNTTSGTTHAFEDDPAKGWPHWVDNVSAFNRGLLEVHKYNRPLDLKNIDDDTFHWLMAVFNEELHELTEARGEEDFVGQVDAIIDLIYFAIGGLIRMGLEDHKIKAIFHDVHMCNMRKKRGKKEGRDTFGDTADAVKPEGWTPPEDLIRHHLNEQLKAGRSKRHVTEEGKLEPKNRG